jgi:predicted peroxiredoxin
MPGLRGLTILVAEPSPARFRTALTLAAAQAALGAKARLFVDGAAVVLLRPPVRDDADPDFVAAGMPALADLLGEALVIGVEVSACQSGLALTGTNAAVLDPRIDFGGMIGLLQTLDDDRLVVV